MIFKEEITMITQKKKILLDSNVIIYLMTSPELNWLVTKVADHIRWNYFVHLKDGRNRQFVRIYDDETMNDITEYSYNGRSILKVINVEYNRIGVHASWKLNENDHRNDIIPKSIKVYGSALIPIFIQSGYGTALSDVIEESFTSLASSLRHDYDKNNIKVIDYAEYVSGIISNDSIEKLANTIIEHIIACKVTKELSEEYTCSWFNNTLNNITRLFKPAQKKEGPKLVPRPVDKDADKCIDHIQNHLINTCGINPMDTLYLNSNKLICIVGSSGSGKDTVKNYILNNFSVCVNNKAGVQRIKPLVETTTRPIRDGEKEGIDYYYVTQGRWNDMAYEDLFLEQRTYETQYGEWHYGTNKYSVDLNHATYVTCVSVEDIDGRLEKYKNFLGEENIICIYLTASIFSERLKRCLNREINTIRCSSSEDSVKKITEIVRRCNNDEKYNEELCKKYFKQDPTLLRQSKDVREFYINTTYGKDWSIEDTIGIVKIFLTEIMTR